MDLTRLWCVLPADWHSLYWKGRCSSYAVALCPGCAFIKMAYAQSVVTYFRLSSAARCSLLWSWQKSVIPDNVTKTNALSADQPGCPSVTHLQHLWLTFRECVTYFNPGRRMVSVSKTHVWSCQPIAVPMVMLWMGALHVHVLFHFFSCRS